MILLFEVIASKIRYFLSSNPLFSPTYESLTYPVQRPSQTSSIGEQLRNLRRKFSDRTEAIKEIIHQAPDSERDATSSYLYFISNENLLFLFLKGNSITVREEQRQKEVSPRSMFSSDSESRASTVSMTTVNAGLKQRLQRNIQRCIRKSGFRKPVDTDSKFIHGKKKDRSFSFRCKR